jgi:hypothetical protein
MKAWPIDWHFSIVILMCAGLTALGLWTFVRAFNPAPTEFYRTTGTVDQVEIHHGKWNPIISINFKVRGSSETFVYPDVLPHIREVSSVLVRGRSAEIAYTKQAESRPQLWSLKLNDKMIIDVPGTYRAYRKDGYWGLFLAVAAALGGAFLWRLAIKVRAS